MKYVDSQGKKLLKLQRKLFSRTIPFIAIKIESHFFFICNRTPTKISGHDTWISMRSVPFLWIDLQPLLKLRTCDYLALILKSLKLICTTAAKGCYLFIVLIFRGYQQVKQRKNKKMLTTQVSVLVTRWDGNKFCALFTRSKQFWWGFVFVASNTFFVLLFFYYFFYIIF